MNVAGKYDVHVLGIEDIQHLLPALPYPLLVPHQPEEQPEVELGVGILGVVMDGPPGIVPIRGGIGAVVTEYQAHQAVLVGRQVSIQPVQLLLPHLAAPGGDDKGESPPVLVRPVVGIHRREVEGTVIEGITQGSEITLEVHLTVTFRHEIVIVVSRAYEDGNVQALQDIVGDGILQRILPEVELSVDDVPTHDDQVRVDEVYLVHRLAQMLPVIIGIGEGPPVGRGLRQVVKDAQYVSGLGIGQVDEGEVVGETIHHLHRVGLGIHQVAALLIRLAGDLQVVKVHRGLRRDGHSHLVDALRDLGPIHYPQVDDQGNGIVAAPQGGLPSLGRRGLEHAPVGGIKGQGEVLAPLLHHRASEYRMG